VACLRLAAWSLVALAASTVASYAGPCATRIDNMQARIDAALEAKAAAGPTAKEGGFAGMSDQPTPRSMAAAEVRMGELSPHAAAVVKQAMAQARAADAAGNETACKRALARVRRVLRH
jgi:hypothetical protein